MGEGSQRTTSRAAVFTSYIRERETEIARLDVTLRAPRRMAPKIEELREALTQRTEQWRKTLREEPKVGRLLLRRLVDPLRMIDESRRPDFIEAVAEVKTGLLDGLHHVASPTRDRVKHLAGELPA